MVVHWWASSHWEGGVLVPYPWICVGLWLFLQVTMWLPRLGRKRPYSFCLGTLVFGMFFLKIHFPCLKKLKPHEKANPVPANPLPESSFPIIPAQMLGTWVKQMIPVSHTIKVRPSLLYHHICWGPRHCGAGKSYSHWALSELLTNKICEHI